MRKHKQKFRKHILASVISSVTIAAANTHAQQVEEVVVTGIRASLKSSMDAKRDAVGVVDSINAEDIGKFPTSNLAESLQRIPGVSINRVNGEGSQITVRGFGPGFNQVTLNGRSLPTADVPLVGGDGRNTGGDSRAFDFSNLASDGIRSLEVYKSGKAGISSGGIGATVNILTRRPLDNPGFQAAISAKAIRDTSVDRGDETTPELAGTLSWSNDEETFGVGFFASSVQRDSAAPSSNSANWNVIPYSDFLGFTDGNTKITNAPTNPDQFVTLPRDSRYQFSEFTGERTNGQLVLQFQPSDSLSLTTDYTFAVNEGEETSSQVSNWFAQNFTEVVFSSSPVPSTIFLKENSANRGAAMEQSTISTKDELKSFGFNAEYDLSDTIKLTFDAHTSEAEVTPNGPMGFSAINVGIDSKYGTGGDGSTRSQAVDYSGDIPVQIIESADGNADVDPVLAASQVANSIRKITQKNEIDQIDLRADWELDDRSNLTFGMNYRSQSNLTDDISRQQILGNWGAEFPGDINALLPGALEQYCVSCRFNDHTIGGATSFGGPPNSTVFGLRGDAAAIFAALSPHYSKGFTGVPGTVFNRTIPINEDDDRTLRVTSSNFNEIEEDVFSLFAQLNTDTEIGGIDANISVGLRYESTDLESKTKSRPAASIIWQGNNDFATLAAEMASGLQEKTSYDHLLPNLDLTLDLSEDLKFRASYSKTIARPSYDNLFASIDVNTPPGPVALGNKATANRGDPQLKPLESDNIDVSLEWYFGDSSYVSVGAFDKRIRNFVGRETVTQNLFGLRDASSGAPGSRSGEALDILKKLGVTVNQDNLFAATVYVDTEPTLAAAEAKFVANQGADGNIDSGVYEAIESDFDVKANDTDPFFDFALNQPVNRDAKINGMEFQGQHFFGETGFGVSGSFTFVDGDVGIDVAGAPSVTQFALVGLSDTANLTLIYENFGFSARLAYNWRDKFLDSANDTSGFNNPVFFEAYSQIDLSVGYDVNDNLSFSFDAINLNEERTRTFTRSEENLLFLRENGARYFLGARYKF